MFRNIRKANPPFVSGKQVLVTTEAQAERRDPHNHEPQTSFSLQILDDYQNIFSPENHELIRIDSESEKETNSVRFYRDNDDSRKKLSIYGNVDMGFNILDLYEDHEELITLSSEILIYHKSQR